MTKEEKVYNGFHKIIRVQTEVKGRKVFRERLVLKEAVAALIIDENERMAIVSQYRPIAEVQSLELPAGLLDKDGLTPIETLLEELQEECDLNLDDIIYFNETPIYRYYMAIGSSKEKINIYEIRVKAQKELEKLVTDVDVDKVIWYTFEEVEDLIKKGLIADSKTINAFNYWKIKKLQEELNKFKK